MSDQSFVQQKSSEQQLEEYKAVLRAQRALKRKIEDIAWKYETFLPEVENHIQKALEGHTIDVQIVEDESR